MARKYEPNKEEKSSNGKAKEALLKESQSATPAAAKRGDDAHELTPLKKGEQEEEVKVVSRAPDGGYGWVIVIASFMCNLIVDGVAYSFAVYFMEWQDYFGAPADSVSLIGSLLNGVYLMMGPISTALTNAFGFRVVIFSGAIITAGAFILSAFATSVTYLIITFGIIGGIGFGLIYSPAILCVCYYFEKKRAMAVGICVCGSGVGAFVCPPIIQMVVDYYGWSGSMYILAGMALQACVAGAFMRTLEVEVQEEVEMRPAEHVSTLQPAETETFVRDSDRSRSLSGPSKSESGRDRHVSESGEGEMEIVRSKKYFSQHGLDIQTMEDGKVQHHYTRADYTQYVSNPDVTDEGGHGIVRRKSVKEYMHPLDKKDVLVQGSLKHIPQGEIAEAEAEAFVKHESEKHSPVAEQPKKKSILPEPLLQALKELADLRVYKNWVFLVFSLASFLGMIAFYIPFTFISKMATESFGVDKDSAVRLISIIGATNTVGRVWWGWVADRPRVDPLFLHNCCVIAVGISMLFVPACGSYTELAVLCGVFGFFVSPFISLLSIILTSRISLALLPSAFGHSQLVRGVASVAGAPIGGALYEIKKNFTITMIAGGTEFLICAAIASVILVVEFVRRRRRPAGQNQPAVEA